jgi:hypothetical protein
MDLKKVILMFEDLAKKRFYGTVQIEFRAGRPYLGLRTEKLLFDKPTDPGPKSRTV